MCCILMFAVYYDMVHPHYVLLSLRIITLSGILAWCVTPVIFNGVNRPWRLRWNAAGRCHNILDVISDLF